MTLTNLYATKALAELCPDYFLENAERITD